MKRYTIGMIGCGNMGGALVLAASRSLPVGEIAVCDRHDDKCEHLSAACGAVRLSAREIASSCRFIVLGVKPKGLSETLSSISDVLLQRKDAVVVSMAAGVDIATIRKQIGEEIPLIRIMPNTPVSVGAGVILYSPSKVSDGDEAAFLHAFSSAGRVDRIDEKLMDCATAISGCGPAFVYLFAEALADGGVECGLTREKAALYAAETLRGAAEMLLQYGNPSALKDAVCSPGGSTIAGVHALEQGGLRACAMDAVCASYQKTKELKN